MKLEETEPAGDFEGEVWRHPFWILEDELPMVVSGGMGLEFSEAPCLAIRQDVDLHCRDLASPLARYESEFPHLVMAQCPPGVLARVKCEP